jgi:glutamate-1-semialdehyde 2,1-aminomutase
MGRTGEMMQRRTQSEKLLERNKQYIPGGVVSVNRATDPAIVFARGEGARIWDLEGNEYLDYHVAFGPHFLGHNDPHVTEAVSRVLEEGASLFGAGTTALEGELAKLICEHVPSAESVQLLNTGSEATYQAIRLGRAFTERDHIIRMQGGYNGWHNDVACNLMTPLSDLGPRVSPGEYPFRPISAGIPVEHQKLVHSVNFNDLESVRYVCERYPVAALITEPILQNIGVVKPEPQYMSGLRSLADEFGFVLIFDEVKTGFRHALGGYASLQNVVPDLVVFGKAIANGYPMAVLAGRKEMMDRFVDPSPARRVLLAGTYNAHPVPTAAAIATIERLLMNDGEVYRHTEELGEHMQRGLEEIFASTGIPGVVARQGSAFCWYFMDHSPTDWHDLAMHHDFALDTAFRAVLVERGIYVFPLPPKQCSISAAHTRGDIELTLRHMKEALAEASDRTSEQAQKVGSAG